MLSSTEKEPAAQNATLKDILLVDRLERCDSALRGYEWPAGFQLLPYLCAPKVCGGSRHFVDAGLELELCTAEQQTLETLLSTQQSPTVTHQVCPVFLYNRSGIFNIFEGLILLLLEKDPDDFSKITSITLLEPGSFFQKAYGRIPDQFGPYFYRFLKNCLPRSSAIRYPEKVFHYVSQGEIAYVDTLHEQALDALDAHFYPKSTPPRSRAFYYAAEALGTGSISAATGLIAKFVVGAAVIPTLGAAGTALAVGASVCWGYEQLRARPRYVPPPGPEHQPLLDDPLLQPDTEAPKRPEGR